MIVTIDLKPTVEEWLLPRARANGMALERFIENVLEHEAAVPAHGSAASLTDNEKARAFQEWAKSFPADLPILSLEAVSRENLYKRD